MYIYMYIYIAKLYSLALGEQNSMLRLKSFSKFITTGESDRSFNSPLDSTVFEMGETFSVFLLDSSPKSPDLNVSEAICNEIERFDIIKKQKKEKT